MTPEISDQMTRIVHSVYETMLGVPVRRSTSDGSPHPSALTSAVYYAGSWKGALVIECSTAQASDWSARLMSLEQPISMEDARDGLGEVTNMIAGNLKPMLPPGVGLSIPSVIEGANHKLRVLGDSQSEKLGFEDQHGPFQVAFIHAD